MPGIVELVSDQVGDYIKKGQNLLTHEAMNIETTINAEVDGKVTEVLVSAGSQVETGDLLLVIGS
jgi:biotin carboxyl carrier protein